MYHQHIARAHYQSDRWLDPPDELDDEDPDVVEARERMQEEYEIERRLQCNDD